MTTPAPRKDMTLKKPYFRLVADGIKTVEVRVAYENMKKLAPGWEILFRSGDETCLVRVWTCATTTPSRRCWITRTCGPPVGNWASHGTNCCAPPGHLPT